MCGSPQSDWDLIFKCLYQKTIKLNKKETQFVKNKLRSVGQPTNLRRVTSAQSEALDEAYPDLTAGRDSGVMFGLLKKAYYAEFEGTDTRGRMLKANI